MGAGGVCQGEGLGEGQGAGWGSERKALQVLFGLFEVFSKNESQRLKCKIRFWRQGPDPGGQNLNPLSGLWFLGPQKLIFSVLGNA